jgi:hypothetical protein
MTQSTVLPGTGDDEQFRPVTDQREAAVSAREGVERAFLDSLAQFDELYRQLAR